MYKIIIQTTEGQKEVEINDLKDFQKALNPFQKIYISCKLQHCEGEAKKLVNDEKQQYNTKVEITDFNVDWLKIKSACMTTISKAAGKMPNDEWKRKILMAEHSPIRRGNISWKWEEIPYAISTHFVRHHEGCEKFVGTEREDRTGVNREERSQMNYVPMEMDANIQALINISLKRLCTCADPTTRKYWEKVLEAIKEYDENIYRQCVPQCIRCGGCPEFYPCGFFEKFAEQLTKEELINMQERYNKYNDYREKKLILKK